MTDDLPELLCQLGLFKYIDVFEQQEVILWREMPEIPSPLSKKIDFNHYFHMQ